MKRNPISLPAVYFAPSLPVEWHRDLLDWACALLGAFYKRRPTPKPGLDLSDHRLCSLLFRFLCTVLPSLCRKDATAVADLSQILPPVYRGRSEREPSADCMVCRWSTTVRVPPCHCTARCVPSTYCSRAALHVAPHALRQWQARRASRWGRFLPKSDTANRQKTCPALNQEFCATKAKRGKSKPVLSTARLSEVRDFDFSRATLAPVIQGKLETLR
jgi:hypothetical protein